MLSRVLNSGLGLPNLVASARNEEVAKFQNSIESPVNSPNLFLVMSRTSSWFVTLVFSRIVEFLHQKTKYLTQVVGYLRVHARAVNKTCY